MVSRVGTSESIIIMTSKIILSDAAYIEEDGEVRTGAGCPSSDLSSILIYKQTDYGEDISELILQIRDDDPQPLSEVFGCVCLNLVKP